MKRLNTYVCSTKAALQETPEILKAICVNFSASVCFRMVHEFVKVFILQPIVSAVRICIECCSRFNMLADERLNIFAASVV